MASADLGRDEKVRNLLLNYTMILMGSFEGVFAELASQMSAALVASTSAIVEGLAGDAGESSDASKTHVDPQKKPETEVGARVSEGVEKMFKDLRAQVSSDLSLKDHAFEEYIRNPAFDEGIKIVERHSVGLPKLTEHLTDADLAAYMGRLRDGDKELTGLLQELAEWQKDAPKPEGLRP